MLAAYLLALSFIAAPVTAFATAPSFASAGVSQTVTVGDVVTFTEVATDVDGNDPMVYTLSGEPSGATIDSSTAAFSWDTTGATPGTFTFSVVATDAASETQSLPVSITVNAAPQTYQVNPGDDLAAIVAAANAGDTIVINGTHTITSTVNVTKAVMIQGGSAGAIETSGGSYAFLVTAPGTTISGLSITKTDTVSQNIIGIQASNVTIQGNSFTGQYGQPDTSHVSRGLEVSTVSNLTVSANSFTNLRQPAYINDGATGSITDNSTSGTRGWVIVANSDFTITGNTWGTNVFDIAFIPGSPNNYEDVVAISDANNGANIENQAFSTPVLADVYVDDSAAPAGNGTAAKPYQTISEAMSRVVEGGTVHVADGTYAESVAVSKPMTLLGAQAGVDARTRSGAESVVTGSAGAATPFVVTADSVTIDGFTVTEGAGTYGSGIYSAFGSENLSVVNNIVSGSQIGLFAECGPTCLVQFNLFDGTNSLSGAAGGAGIYTERSSGLTIVDNEFKNHLLNSAVIFATAGGMTHENVSFERNSLHDNSQNDSSVYVLGVDTGTFQDNTITNAGTGSTALSFSGSNENIRVLQNVLTGGARGIRINDDFGTNADFKDIENNQISGQSQFGLGILGAGYAGAISAERNWWGDVTGPNDGGVNANATGAAIVGNIDYTPWCTSADCSSLNTDSTGGGNGGSSGSSGSSSNGGSSNSDNDGGDADNGGGQVLGAATYNFTTDLWFGMNNADVSALQQLLIDAGYLKIAAPTGYFGPLTQAALKQWQAAHGVPATGYFGPLTRAAIAASATPTPAMTDAEVEARIKELMKEIEALKAAQ